MEIIDHYYYTKEHEWVNIEENIGTVGITDYAQSALGDITYVELPQEDQEVEQFEQFVSVESVKAASDIFCPMSGRVVEINDKLEDNPALINKDCYNKGWIAKIEIKDMEETSNLMSAEDYRSYLDTLAQ
jgi:glycine cleavage system H protein